MVDHFIELLVLIADLQNIIMGQQFLAGTAQRYSLVKSRPFLHGCYVIVNPWPFKLASVPPLVVVGLKAPECFLGADDSHASYLY